MAALLSFILHPLPTVKFYPDDDNEHAGIDVFYILTVFLGLGAWLIVQRYHHSHNSPIPFVVNDPLPADPFWESIRIDHPNLESHAEHPYLIPGVGAEDSRRYITSFDPATSLHLGASLADNDSEIRHKIDLAANAQKTWKNTTFTQRRRVVRSLLKWLVDNQELVARVACRDTGKTLLDASLGEILTTCSKMEWLLNHGERVLRPERRAGNLLLAYKRSEVHYEPLGVVAALVSWDYPLHNAWGPILAAIFAGNGVVLKCSERVIWSTGWYVNAIQTCLSRCGHDRELVQIVCCWPEKANVLIKSPKIKHITFIGSETVGRQVAIAATEHLTPLTMELGGKDPAVILPGADLDKSISLWVRGVLQNMGQNCVGIERFIVHHSQYDDLYDLLVERFKNLRCGSVLAPSPEGYVQTIDCGSMISDERFDALEQLIHEAREAGANVFGGHRLTHDRLENGYFFAPTVVGPVYTTMEIANEELFAPIALVMPYQTLEEAIEIANSTKYGLAASVYGPDQEDCVAVAKKLECGMVSINDFGTFYLNQDLPFGGTKASGYGRFGGPEGLRALTSPKAVMTDRWPTLIQTSIPRVMDYPVLSLSQSWEFSSNIVRFLYADGWRARFRALAHLISAKKS